MNRIQIKQIVWDEDFRSDNKYDYVCMADCLFFRDFHEALQVTIAELLEDSDEEGRVLIVGPNRSNTVSEFIDTLNKGEMFDHSIDPIDDYVARVDDESDPLSKSKRIVENENDINLNDENRDLRPNIFDPDYEENPLNIDDLEGDDELNNRDPLGYF